MTNHIIINNTIPRIRYVSNGVLATYTFPFAIFKTSDLKVYFDSTLQNASTYTVSGAGESSGGSVVLSSIPASGVIITLTRELSIERTSDFQEGGALRADTLNQELDYQIACQQQIADNLNRSMVLPPYAADINVSLTLPLPNAGKAIVWNAAGTNLENSTLSVNEMESTIRGYKTAAESAATTATTQATTATQQATIATQKAQEATAAISSKLNTTGDNIQLTDFLTNLSITNDIAERGYYKLPGGLIIQWGNETTSGTKLFPIAFPTTALTITSGYVLVTGTTWYGQSINVVSNTSFTVDLVHCTKLCWIAIGY